jgi:hypothetical protein
VSRRSGAVVSIKIWCALLAVPAAAEAAIASIPE